MRQRFKIGQRVRYVPPPGYTRQAEGEVVGVDRWCVWVRPDGVSNIRFAINPVNLLILAGPEM